jgi:hypothetical protein
MATSGRINEKGSVRRAAGAKKGTSKEDTKGKKKRMAPK